MAEAVRITLTDPMVKALDFIRKETSPLLKNNEIIKNAISEYYANVLEKMKREDRLVNISEDWDYWVTTEEEKRIRKSYDDAQIDLKNWNFIEFKSWSDLKNYFNNL